MAKKLIIEDFANSIPVRSTIETLDMQGFHVFTAQTRADKRAKTASRLLLEEFKNKFQSMTAQPFKPAKLFNAGGDVTKDWYVEFYYLLPGSLDKFHRFKERFGINRYKKFSDKMAFGKEMVDFYNQKLQMGFNPFTAQTNSLQGDFRIVAQLTKASVQMGRFSTNITISSHNEVLNRFIKFIAAKKMEQYFINGVTVQHSIAFKNWGLYEQDFSVKTVNSSIGVLSNFFDKAIEMGMTMQNPFKQLPRAKKRDKDDSHKDVRFEPFTDKEMQVIFPWLKENGKGDFVKFCSVIYYAFARPIEILRLKVGDIEMERNLIRFKQNQTKNDSAAYVQIVPPLMAMFEAMELYKYPADHYIFSDDFLPGERMLNKSLPGKYWRLMVKQKLGVNKDMYALKHTGNIEYLLNNKNNTNLKWQQMQNRHKTANQTDVYNRKLGVYFIEVGEVNFRVFE